MRARATLFALALPLCAAAQPIAFQHSGDIAWACGGVGSDERRELDSMRGEAGLEVLMVTASRGAYLSGVHLAIAPARGTAPPVTLDADGPTCLIQAPPGAYRVQASYEGATRVANARISTRGKPSRVVIAFPDREWDGIRASEEEKREARSP